MIRDDLREIVFVNVVIAYRFDVSISLKIKLLARSIIGGMYCCKGKERSFIFRGSADRLPCFKTEPEKMAFVFFLGGGPENVFTSSVCEISVIT